MSVINYEQSLPIPGNSKFMLVSWNNMANGDTGQPYTLAEFADRSVHVVGTFGVGGLVEFQGTNDSNNWASLSDPQGNAISISLTNKIEAVSEIVVAVRPKIAGGDGTTSISVHMLVRKN